MFLLLPLIFRSSMSRTDLGNEFLFLPFVVIAHCSRFILMKSPEIRKILLPSLLDCDSP